MQFLYNIAAIIVVLLIIPVFLVRAIRERGFIERIRQSLGFIPEDALEKVAKKNCIWVHAASVGEIVAASPLIKEFRNEFPKSPILVSVVTTSGYEMANRIIKDADSIIYSRWICRSSRQESCAGSRRACSCRWRPSCGRTFCGNAAGCASRS